MALTRRQKLALKRSTATTNLWYGSVRAAKTFASIWAFIRDMAEYDGRGVVLVVGKSTNTVWRNFFIPILTKPEFAHIAPHLVYRQSASTGTLFGNPFSVVGASNDAAWQSIQGLTVWRAHGDEATTWPKSFWDMLQTRLSLPDSRLTVTCNPGTSNHYLKTEVIDKADIDPDIHVEKFLIYENPTLPKPYIKRLLRQYTGVFRRRMIDAEWVAAEGAVYEDWEPEKMVTTTMPDVVELLSVGIDYGTNHPTAGHALGITSDGKLCLVAEWAPNNTGGSHRRLTDAQLADSFQQWLTTLPMPPRYIYCDPAAASFREELKSRGISTARADNKMVDGIRTVDSLLTNGVLTIHSSCRQLINEIPGYRWDPKATEHGNDAPIKEADDYCDSMRYAVHSCRHLWRRRTG